MKNIPGRLEVHPERGVIYFFSSGSNYVLKIQGLPKKIQEKDFQLEIHLIEKGSEHHHEFCDGRGHPDQKVTADPGMICAVKL